MLVQRASDSVMGYAYELKNGSLVPVLRALPGLTMLPKSGSQALLYGTSAKGALSLFTRLSAITTASRLPITTIADKCVWAEGSAPTAYCAVPQTSPPEGFLDSWYRGEAHSSDALWRIDASAGSAELVFAPDSSISIDVENLSIDSSNRYVAFTNARDQSLWLLRLVQ